MQKGTGVGDWYIVRGAIHDIWGGDFHAETHRWKAGSDHDDPEDSDGCKGKYGDAAGIFEDKADEECTCLRNILREKM